MVILTGGDRKARGKLVLGVWYGLMVQRLGLLDRFAHTIDAFR